MSTPKRLYRSRTNRMIAGVAGGVAEYAGVDATLVRLIWLVILLVAGSGLLLYILAWIIIPNDPRQSLSQTGEPDGRA